MTIEAPVIIEVEAPKTKMTLELLRIIQKYPIRVESANIPFNVDVTEITGYHNLEKPQDLYWVTDAPGLGVAKMSAPDLADKCKHWAYSLGYLMESFIYNNAGRVDMCKTGIEARETQQVFKEINEQEAIFAAVESIRKDQIKAAAFAKVARGNDDDLTTEEIKIVDAVLDEGHTLIASSQKLIDELKEQASETTEILPSKELVSFVFDTEVTGVEKTSINEFEYYDIQANHGDGLWMDENNIHEFASLAKEAIYKKYRISLQSCIDDVDWMCEIRMVMDRPQWFARTEPEAIIRACEDILKDPEQKGYVWS